MCIILSMKLFYLLLTFSLLLALSCGTAPEPAETVETAPQAEVTPPPRDAPPAAVVIEVPAEEPPGEPDFDPVNITQSYYESTIADVQALIGNLNRIIRARNYSDWVSHLSVEYYSSINTREFLEEKTEELFRLDQAMARGRPFQRRTLNTSRDYFDNVVVPSRQNDRVDDIVFVTENRVIAYTVNTRGDRLILYNLEYAGNGWKIVN